MLSFQLPTEDIYNELFNVSENPLSVETAELLVTVMSHVIGDHGVPHHNKTAGGRNRREAYRDTVMFKAPLKPINQWYCINMLSIKLRA